MTAWMDEAGTLHVASEAVYELLALKAWLEKYQVTNINGVNMIPSRALIVHSGPSPRGDSRP